MVVWILFERQRESAFRRRRTFSQHHILNEHSFERSEKAFANGLRHHIT